MEVNILDIRVLFILGLYILNNWFYYQYGVKQGYQKAKNRYKGVR